MGSATFDHEHHSAVVSTRHYRYEITHRKEPLINFLEPRKSFWNLVGIRRATFGLSVQSFLNFIWVLPCFRLDFKIYRRLRVDRSVKAFVYSLSKAEIISVSQSKTHDNLEHLAMMERILGPLPSHMINVSSSNRPFSLIFMISIF